MGGLEESSDMESVFEMEGLRDRTVNGETMLTVPPSSL